MPCKSVDLDTRIRRVKSVQCGDCGGWSMIEYHYSPTHKTSYVRCADCSREYNIVYRN